MPSTYTPNLGIRKPGNGEEDGVWGTIVNTNSDIIDRVSNGTLFLTLTGTASTLTTADGLLSDGQYKVLSITGTLAATHTITIVPNDAQKIYFVRNLTTQTVTFTQGSGGNMSVPAGTTKIIYTTGTGATSAIGSFTDTLGMLSPTITGGAISGATITATDAALTNPAISGGTITGLTNLDVTAGTAALPAYSFNTDTNTGIYSAGADSLGFSTGGTNRLLLGNTSLATTFNGTAAVPAYSFTTDTNTGMYLAGTDTLAFTSGGGDAVRMAGDGVYLPAATTEARFIEIGNGRTGNGACIIDLIGDATYTDYGARLVRGSTGANATTSLTHRGTGNLELRVSDAGILNFYTSSAERMRITSGGFVGIGVTSPAVMLDVSGSGDFGGNLSVQGNLSTGAIVEVGTLGSGNRNSVVDFHSSGAPGAIDYSARIIRGAGVNGQFDFYNSGSGNYNWVVNGTTRMSISGTTGRVSLSGGAARGFSGNVLTTQTDSVANAFRASGYIEWQTDVGAIGTTYFLSDERKKDNIAPSVQSSSDLINQINFIQFDWKPESGNTGHVNVGVSAQQLQGIDSRLTHELSDGGLMVSEPALVAHIAKALQEALAKIDALEARITALEA